MKSIPLPLLIIIWLLFGWLVFWVAETVTKYMRANGPASNPDSPKKEKVENANMFAVFRVGLLLLSVFFVNSYFTTRYDHGPTITIEGNLKQWANAFKIYSKDSPGRRFPPLDQNSNLWVPDLNVLSPVCFVQSHTLTDPGNYYIESRIHDVMKQDSPDLDEAMRLMAQTYVYPGWAVQKNIEVELMKRLRSEEHVYEGDFEEENIYLWWMREGIERLFVTDINDFNNPDVSHKIRTQIPTMVARPRYETYNFYRKSTFWWRYYLRFIVPDKPRQIVIPVLYLDGHVEMVPQDEAPDYIKALVEFLPEPTLTSQEATYTIPGHVNVKHRTP